MSTTTTGTRRIIKTGMARHLHTRSSTNSLGIQGIQTQTALVVHRLKSRREYLDYFTGEPSARSLGEVLAAVIEERYVDGLSPAVVEASTAIEE